MKNTFTIILLLLVSTVHAQTGQVYTLQKCIDIALENNLTLSTTMLRMESDKARLMQSRATTLPYVTGYLNQGINNGKSINPYTNSFVDQRIATGQYGLNGSLNLFSGFSYLNTMRKNLFTYQADKSDIEQAKIDLTIQVTIAYLQILSNEELLNQANAQLELTQTQIDRLDVLEKNNAVNPSTWYDTKGLFANDKINLINTKAALATSKLNLAQLLNTNFSADAKFEKVATAETFTAPATINENKFTELPAAKSAELKSKSAKRSLSAAQGLVFPSISLNGNIGTNYSSAALMQSVTGSYTSPSNDYVEYNGNQLPVITQQYNYNSEKIKFNTQAKNNLNTYIGLSVQVPIFNALSTRTQIKYAQVAVKQSVNEQKNTETRLKTILTQDNYDVLNAWERYTVFTQQVSDYQESFRIATTKFEKGAISTFDYITSKTNAANSKANLISAQYDLILRKKILDLYSVKK